MAGPKPDDPYTPNNRVSTDTKMPYDTLSVRATGEDFGAAKGRALEQGGKELEASTDRMQNFMLQQQGLANEHSATAAEMQLAIQGGQIYNNYKNLEGLDASNSKDKYIADYTALNDKIRKGLSNPQAQRAYDQLAIRRMQFTIQDMNGYAAQQQKAAYKQGNAASTALSLDRLSSPDVANSEAQSSFEIGNAIHQLNTDMTAPEYGDFQTVPATIGKDGKLKFDVKTPQGKIAQDTYNYKYDKMMDQAWTNRISAIANDPDGYNNVNRAVTMLQQNKVNMSIGTYAKLANKLDGPYRTGQARDMADSELSLTESGYQSANSEDVDTGHAISTLIPGAVITSAGRTPEHNAEVGGVYDSQHLKNTALDIVLPKGTTSEQFKSQLATVGIKTTEFIDEGDHVHVAWGDKSGSSKAGGYVSKADYYRENYDDILNNVRQKADKKWGDPALTDQTVAFAQTKINQVIHGEELQQRVDKDTVLDFAQGKSNKGIQVTNVDQLYNGPPKVRDAWIRFQADNPYGAQQIEKGLLVANAEGQSLVYGSNFWKNYLAMTSGRQPDVTHFDVSHGKTSAFTNTGFQELLARQNDAQTPEGKTWQTAEVSYLKQLQRDYTASGLVPGGTENDTSAEFNQVLKEILPRISSGKREGKTVTQLFSPTINGKPNPDYISPSVLPPNVSTIMMRRGALAMFNNGEVPTSASQQAPVNPSPIGDTDYKSVDDVGQAYKSGKLTKDEAYGLINKRFGGFAPGVPRPKD